LTAENILYIVLAAVLAFAIAFYMYGYKIKQHKQLSWVFGFLRFITLFSLFLLLVNPKFRSETTQLQKPKLPVLVDVSGSIKEWADSTEVQLAVDKFRNNEPLNDKFEVQFFVFGDSFRQMDSLQFNDRQTQIDRALEGSNELFKKEIAPTVLITDGNQTLGRDYEFTALRFHNSIYPLIVGDSIQYLDLKIEQLNANRYSFLKNQFPVEAILVYSGEEQINSRFVIKQGKTEVFSQNINFTSENNSQTISLSLPANKVGLQRLTALIEPVSAEKNKTNNIKEFAVEVIDQATKVLIISDLMHPDLGALKKAIETNEQCTVTIEQPSISGGVLEEYQLIILFQPTRNFSNVISEINRLGKNTLWISGTKTDWRFLNSVQDNFQKEAANVSEDVNGLLNLNYGNYAIEDVEWTNYPPLRTEFGDLTINVPFEIILNQQINGFTTGNAMLATTDLNGNKSAVWDGEGIWKWRAHDYLENGTFKVFDEFLGKLIQYMSSSKRKSRLEVTHETFYYSNTPISIAAQYFDQNFVFDNRAQVEIRVVNQESKLETVFPMLLKNNFYEVDLNSLPSGDYSFTVLVKDQGLSRIGNFTILDFNVEKQFLNADVTKLSRVATHSNGKKYYLKDVDRLIQDFINNESLRPVVKTQRKIVPLIDWKYLLAVIAMALAAEWFIRKYNGLI
jgi:hypothetical protein